MTKEEAISQLRNARVNLSLHAQNSARALRPQTLVTQSVKHHPAWWIAGATVAGFVVIRSFMPSRKKNERDNTAKSSTKNGLLALAMTSLVGIGQKAALAYFTKQILPNLEGILKPRDQDESRPF